MKIRLVLFLLLGISNFLFGQSNYPVPKKTSILLFYAQHNQNHNTFVYELNVENGKLNKDNPIVVSRINYEGNKAKEPINLIQKKYAYGVNYQNEDKTTFYLSANKNIPMYIKSKDNKSWIEVKINNKDIILDKIFIQTDKDSKGIKTKVEYIILEGKDKKGNLIKEKFVP